MPGGYEWIIIIAVLLLLFGAKKLPDMARSVGQSARVFKGEMKGLKDDESAAKSAKPAEGTAPTPPQALPTSTTDETPADPVPQAQPAATPQAQPAAAPPAQPGRSNDAT